MAFSIHFHNKLQEKADTAIIGIYKDSRLSASAEKLDEEIGGFLDHYINEQKKFTGKKGETLIIAAPQNSAYTRIIAIGFGDPAKLNHETAETIGGKLFLSLRDTGAEQAVLFISDDQARENTNTGDLSAHILMGLKLRSYEFKKYKSTKKAKNKNPAPKLQKISLISDKSADADAIYKPLSSAAEGVFWARDLVNEPPNKLYPESYAQMIKDELRPLGVDIEIFDERKMEKLGFHAAYEVGKGSIRQPRIVVMQWNGGAKKPSKDNPPLAFVGKGVTFDTGGISLKPGAGMADMKLDMGGSAAVVGLMKSLALRKANANVVAIVGLAENMPSERAYRPSDVIESMSGKTIEVLNTDAEGRLVLADCMTYIQRTYKPKLMIDLATLTGAMMVALGHKYCGTFVNNDELWDSMNEASAQSTEKLWRMPLDEAYRKEMDSTIADLKNLGTNSYGGACTAAGFLERFVEDDCPWAHMDIAGTAWVKSDSPTCPKPATGFGVRVLDKLVDKYS